MTTDVLLPRQQGSVSVPNIYWSSNTFAKENNNNRW